MYDSMRHLVLGLLLTLSILLPSLVLAHEVLPEIYLEFVRENPNYSSEEFDVFMTENPALRDDGDFMDHIIVVQQEPESWLHNVRDFVRLGIIHILEGTDHVLFVLSLLLIYSTFKREVVLLTVFTLAHSISLIVAGSGILTLSSRVVEPVVALSITYMAITSVFFKHIKVFSGHANKVSTVFLFGLFHGLGFAGLLKDIQVPDDRFVSSLLSFNIGIELGQFAIVAAALPFIYLFRKKKWYPKVVKVIAVVIAVFGLVWGFQRIFL
ncbi:MAG: hydrogenase/urease accessory protein HupE [Candidatus Azotimanducaceae bacterium]|jgi:hydrogenase/urease accessory protein HupE